MSWQPRRARLSNIDFLARYDYLGLRHLVTQGCIFDQELLYDKFPNELLPFDFDAYFRNRTVFEMVTTNCLTGGAMYLTEKNDKQRTLDLVRASSSLPFVSKIVNVDGIPMLDGGIVDSIPVQRAIDTGHDFNVVVMTRNYGFRASGKDHKIPYFVYKKYPRLRVALGRRLEVYNNQLQLVEDLEREGRVACIRPQRPMDVGRIEKDTNKLEALYEEGFEEGEKFIANLKAGMYVHQ